MSVFSYVMQDYYVNTTAKIRVVLLLFRLSSVIRSKGSLVAVFFFWIPMLYRFLSDWVLGIDIPVGTEIGPRVRIYHGFGLVVGKGAVIGCDCILRQGVTIGRKISKSGEVSLDPVVGDGVEFGAYSAAIGEIVVGNDSILGLGVCVVNSLDDGSVVVSQPYRKLR